MTGVGSPSHRLAGTTAMLAQWWKPLCWDITGERNARHTGNSRKPMGSRIVKRNPVPEGVWCWWGFFVLVWFGFFAPSCLAYIGPFPNDQTQ